MSPPTLNPRAPVHSTACVHLLRPSLALSASFPGELDPVTISDPPRTITDFLGIMVNMTLSLCLRTCDNDVTRHEPCSRLLYLHSKAA